MFSKGSKPDGEGATAPPPTPAVRDSAAPKSASVPSIISGDLKITGNMESSGDIQVDGAVHGDITSRTLTIGEEADVNGAIVAESVRVCGHVKGEIRATSVVLAKTSRVEGDLVHQSLAIEAGAYIEGNIRRLEPEGGGESNVSMIKPVSEEPAPAPAAAPGTIAEPKPVAG